MRKPLALAVVLLAGLAVPTAAQQASYTLFGSTPAHGPSLSAIGTPQLGSSLTLQVSGCPGTYYAFPGVVWGTSNLWWGGVSLPVDLTNLYAGGIALAGSAYVSIDVVVWGWTAQTPWDVTVTIPNAPALLGLSFYNQALCDRGCSPPGCNHSLQFGNAGHGIIGT